MMTWLVGKWQWPAAALFAGIMLLAIAPTWHRVAGLALALVFLQLPVYMLHQWEEHAGDRFRLYVNLKVCGGREALTPIATFWINSLGVWGVDLAALYLACYVDLALGLIAIYMPLVNGVGHLVPMIVRREYNPGLGTAIVLFLPVGIASLVIVSRASRATWVDQLIGLGAAIAVHAAILIHVARRLKHLGAATA